MLKITRHFIQILGLMLALSVSTAALAQRVEGAPGTGPRYMVDPYWPKPLPNNWILGQVAGIATGKFCQ